MFVKRKLRKINTNTRKRARRTTYTCSGIFFPSIVCYVCVRLAVPNWYDGNHFAKYSSFYYSCFSWTFFQTLLIQWDLKHMLSQNSYIDNSIVHIPSETKINVILKRFTLNVIPLAIGMNGIRKKHCRKNQDQQRNAFELTE